MTVPTLNSVAEFATNGVTTNFPFFFKFLANEDLVVTYINPTGVSSVLMLGTQYTVNGAGNEAGGSIVTVSTLAGPGQLIVSREMEAFQQTSLRNQGKFLAETHEDVFDRLTMLIQQGFSIFKRALTRPFGRDYFYAENRRITSLADPTDAQDAVTKYYNERYIAGLLDDFTGPLNNAANVMFVYPDGVARSVQSLSSYTNVLMGSQGIGHYNPLGTIQTVGMLLDAHTAGIAANAAAITETFNAIPVINAAQPLMSRSSNVLNLGHGVNIIGDSISAGAYQGNVYTNGWPALLAKAINNQFGSKNLGAIPTDALFNPVPAYQTDQLHTVTWFGDWGPLVGSTGIYNWPIGNTGAAAGDAINGKTVSSTNNTAYMEITIPAINNIVTIYYVGQPGGGKFDVSVNGAIVAELNTAFATKTYNLQSPLIVSDGGQGEVVIRLTKKDALPTELQPVVRYQKIVGNPDEHFALMNVCNHSISGRQLATMTEAGIIAATNCAAMVLALGFNDSLAETNTTYYNNFLTRVNWIIQYANNQKCLVVVSDFCWYSATTSKVRTQLKRIAKETKGIYIPFPDKFSPSGAVIVDTTPAASELITSLRLFADNAHPNFKGNEMIFTQIARALGLSVTSKRSALLNDMPFPVKLAGTLKNKAGDVSSVSRVNGGLLYSLGITATGGGNISSGSLSLCTLPAKFYPGAEVRASSDVLSITGAGVINNFTSTLVNGAVNGTIVTASVVEGSFFVAEKQA
ncbi:phage tail fiber protein [Pseudomonas sp. UMAB-40]|uniref:phage tail fiber domain-containing protein n=1 Tax=Pseudomonas sp. UMAB-40 TaxID=1365407 RepID=UPI001C561C4C|nr:phage tail fiber protein [Pseudomonas sp. UMAB-40]